MEEQGAERDDPGTDFEQRVATALERIRPAL